MKYEGGMGARENGDLVRWTLEVNDHDVLVSQRGQFLSGGPVTAELTLHDITRAESEAVVAVVNEMRSASTRTVFTPARGPTIGDRFSGLDL